MYQVKTRSLLRLQEAMSDYAQAEWHMKSYGQKQQNGSFQINTYTA